MKLAHAIVDSDLRDEKSVRQIQLELNLGNSGGDRTRAAKLANAIVQYTGGGRCSHCIYMGRD